MRISDWSSDVFSSDLLRSKRIPYDPSHVEEMVRGARSVFTREFLHRRTAATAVAATAVAARPIFIAGLPRSGSTLVEQILASHPGVEGLGELFDMERLPQIGRASCRERGCRYVLLSVVAVSLKKQTI